MNSLRSLSLLMVAALAVGAKASAQTATPAALQAGSLQDGAALPARSPLPLTSLSDRLMWMVGDQNFDLQVGEAGPVGLELYSPTFDSRDYNSRVLRSPDYYGDERYQYADAAHTQGEVQTTFTLTSEAGQTVKTQTYAAGNSAWTSFFQGVLEPGGYRLSVKTVAPGGKAKNSFALRLSGAGLTLSAEQLNLNLRSSEWVEALSLDIVYGAQPLKLRLYDGDGPQEIEARLRDTSGKVTAINVSSDLEWVDVPLPTEAGSYTLELRQPAKTYQFSNTVGFELRQYGAVKPIVVVQTPGTPQVAPVAPSPVAPAPVEPVAPTPAPVVPAPPAVETPVVVPVAQTGRLSLEAVLLLPDETRPTRVTALVAGSAVEVASSVTEEVKAGDYSVAVNPRAGAKIMAPPRVTVPQNGEARVRITVQPQAGLACSVDRVQAVVGETVTFTATATTEFDEKIPARISLKLPAGLEPLDPTSGGSDIVAGRPGVLTVRAKVTAPGTLSASCALEPYKQALETRVLALTPDQAKLTQTVNKSVVEPGQTVCFIATSSNEGQADGAYTLEFKADASLGGKPALPNASLKLAGGAQSALESCYTVAEDAPATLTRTVLLTDARGKVLEASNSVKVVRDAPTLTQTVNKAQAQPGEEVCFTATVSNVGEAAGQYNLLSKGSAALGGKVLEQTLGLGGGKARGLESCYTVADDAPDSLERTVTLTDAKGKTLQATNRVKVVRDAPKLTQTVDKSVAQPGEEVCFTATVGNKGEAAGQYALEFAPDAGLEGDSPAQKLELASGKENALESCYTVAEDAPDALERTVTLTDAKGKTLEATNSVKVVRDAPTLTQTVNKAQVRPGEEVCFTATVSNGGDALGDYTLLSKGSDALGGDPLEQTLNLDGGKSRGLESCYTVAQDGADDAPDTLERTVTLTDAKGKTLEARNSVEVVRDLPTLTQTVDKAVAQPGDEVCFTVTVGNDGSADGDYTLESLSTDGLQGELVSEPLPLGLGQSQNFEQCFTVAEDAPDTLVRGVNLSSSTGDTLSAETSVQVVRQKLALERSAIPASIPSETVTVRLSAQNTGTAPAPFTLGDDPSDLLEPTTTSSFEGVLEPGAKKDFSYDATVTEGEPATSSAVATLSGKQTLTAETPVERVWLDLEESVVTPRVLVGTPTNFEFTVTNPLERPVKVRLDLESDAGLVLETSSVPLELGAGESRTLSVSATATQPGTFNVRGIVRAGESSQVSNETEDSVLTLPQLRVSRESTLKLPLSLPSEAQSVTVAQKLPVGAVYQSGSSTLGSERLADPSVGADGTLYWTVKLAQPAKTDKNLSTDDCCDVATAGKDLLLSYRVTHSAALGTLPEPALEAQFAGGRTLLLDGKLDSKDLERAGQTEALTENPGFIKLPLAGTIFRDRDRIGITLEGDKSFDLTAKLNGVPLPASALGKTVDDPVKNTLHLEYFGVQLREGKNVLEVGGESVTVFLAGNPVKLEATAQNLVADGFSPLELRVRALDASGLAGRDGFLTVGTNLEPLDPDANPTMPNYQVRLINGEGVLRLRPQAVPTQLKLRLALGDLEQASTFDVRSSATTVAIGTLSATVGLSPLSVDVTGRGYFEGPIGDGKLYVVGAAQYAALDSGEGLQTLKSGGKLPTGETTAEGYTLFGDASSPSVSLQGVDPVAFRFENPAFKVAYAQTELPITALPVSGGYTALTFETKGDTGISGFVAAVPSSTVKRVLRPDGTRLLQIGEALEYGSETVTLVIRDRDTGVELSRTPLNRLTDYTVDAASGVLEFVRPVVSTDPSLNPQSLELSYRTPNPLGNRYLEGGVQVKTASGPFSASLAAVTLRASSGVGDATENVLTVGAKLGYQEGRTNVNASAAYSGGFQASLDAQTSSDTLSLSARARVQTDDYAGVGKGTPGTEAAAAASLKLSPQFSVRAGGTYGSNKSGDRATLEGGLDYSFSPFTVGLGLRQQLLQNPATFLTARATVSAGNLNLSLNHAQALTGGVDPQTQFAAKYAFTPQLSLSFTDNLVWGRKNQAAIGLENRFGNTSFSVNYELPNGDGDGNLARFGASTVLPLSDRVSANLQAGYNTNLEKGTGTLEGGVDLSFRGDGFAASAGVSTNLPSTGDSKVVLKGGLSGSLDRVWTVGLDATSELARESGNRVTFSAAMRDASLEGLGYLRFADGSLKGGSVGTGEITSQLGLTYRAPSFQVRGALSTLDTLGVNDGLLIQPQLGATAYLTDRFGLGIYGRALYQPSLQKTQWGLGLEATFRALDGLWATVGYNPTGFNGIGANTRQGLYFRLDVLLNEVNR